MLCCGLRFPCNTCKCNLLLPWQWQRDEALLVLGLLGIRPCTSANSHWACIRSLFHTPGTKLFIYVYLAIEACTQQLLYKLCLLANMDDLNCPRCLVVHLLQVNASSKFIGLSIVFTAGACYSIFSPAFNLATNDQWHKLDEGVPHLVVYTAFFYFSLAFFACAVLINVCFLYKPAFGVPKSSFGAYLKDNNGRWIALLAGILCGWGNGFQFMGGQAAGYAAADAVQV